MSAQTEYLTRDKNDIYWQPGTKINFSDYQSSSDTSCVKYKEKYGITMSASIGSRGIVDAPKKRSRKFEKFYLAPVFCKNCSCCISEDSLCLKVDQLLFDIAEICVRNARRELLDAQKLMHADNTYSTLFITIKSKWDRDMQLFFRTILKGVLIEKKDSMYTQWRESTDKILEETKEYATPPEDCYRFISDKPIEKGYEMAKYVIGDMKGKDEEK